ncbi:sensor domain-containing protein [Mycobacteroides franklinii]|nr:sensor domain-containing protein [Mycobacteroides franklinii]
MTRALPAVVLSVALLAGCSESVEGQALRTARTGTEQALPTSSELSQALGIQMRQDAAVRVGGGDILKSSANALPQMCVGVAHSGDRQTYKDAHLSAAVQGSWITSGDGDQTRVLVTVVEFSSPADAHVWYSNTTSDWQRCQGITVTERTEAFTFADSVNRVEESDGLLSAELLLSTEEGMLTPTPHSRAVTAALHYGVDVEALGRLEGGNSANVDATAIAHLVAGKVTSAP